MLYPTEAQIESAFESALRRAMAKEQAAITINRYLYGDLTACEGAGELAHQRVLIENWQLGDPLPFGEIE